MSFAKPEATIEPRPDGRVVLRTTREGRFVSATIHADRVAAEKVAKQKKIRIILTPAQEARAAWIAAYPATAERLGVIG